MAAAYEMLADRPADALRQLAQRMLAPAAEPPQSAHELRAHLHSQRKAVDPAALASDPAAYACMADFLAELSMSRTRLVDASGRVWLALAHEQMAGSPLLAEWVAASLALMARLGDHSALLSHPWAAQRLADYVYPGPDPASSKTEDGVPATAHVLAVLVRGLQALDAMRLAAWATPGVSQGVVLFCARASALHRGTWESPALAPLLRHVRRAGGLLDALLRADTWEPACERCARRGLLDVRRDELFSLVVEYPASRPALDDLRACCHGQPAGVLRSLADHLQQHVCRRLLHAGAATADIVGFYAQAVGALGRVDRTGLVLWAAADPIRRYLQTRPDAVTCIVAELLDGALADGSGGLESSGEPEVWRPRPRDAEGAGLAAAADVAGQLLGVFDGDAYVRAFDSMLASRLLRLAAYDASAEVRQVERMGGYLGARMVERSRVMLRDIAESRRLDGQISAERMHATVVSRQFWPPAAREPSWVPPAEMAQVAAQWAGAYEALRPARRLEWRHALGSVALAVEMLDGSVRHVRVRPVDAAVLVVVEGVGRVDAKGVAEALECHDVGWVRGRLRAWVARGVLREPLAGVFEPVDCQAAEHAEVGEGAAGDVEADEQEEQEPEGGMAGVPDLSVQYNYIVGMLTNIGPLPLDRMHAMLAMFVPGDTTTPEQLRAFLAVKLRDDEERLEMSGGMYRLRG
ncbi:Anaphase-promoting complex subunit 2 [Coemansia interrupta]|uniref:Anaphase-promoting complex subunit 2 n=1 Tax=Coemansia interrupta TaxID=1126814 RepID=A0A9W8LN44_9FUNG|nr:Anaphase-promoting complex subunit 2 [Coemansia interrupta]